MDEYIKILFKQYLEAKGYNGMSFLNAYLCQPGFSAEELLIANPDFKRWLKRYFAMHKYFYEHLDNIGVDLYSPDVVELYKGAYDSVASIHNEIISPYADTLSEESSDIELIDNEICKVDKYRRVVKSMGDRKKYLIHNMPSDEMISKIANTIIASNNEVVISTWGDTSDMDALLKLESIKKSIVKLRGRLELKDVKFESSDGIYMVSITGSTRKARPKQGHVGYVSKNGHKVCNCRKGKVSCECPHKIANESLYKVVKVEKIDFMNDEILKEAHDLLYKKVKKRGL